MQYINYPALHILKTASKEAEKKLRKPIRQWIRARYGVWSLVSELGFDFIQL